MRASDGGLAHRCDAIIINTSAASKAVSRGRATAAPLRLGSQAGEAQGRAGIIVDTRAVHDILMLCDDLVLPRGNSSDRQRISEFLARISTRQCLTDLL